MFELMLGGALALLCYIVVRIDIREWKRERERERKYIKRVYQDNSKVSRQADQNRK